MNRDLAALLAEHPVFSGLADGDLELLGGCALLRRIPAGEYLIRSGGDADRFFVIRSGQAAVELTTADRGTVTIDTLTDSDVAGVSWLFPPYRWIFDVRAVTELATIEVDAACLRGKCDADPRLGYALFTRFAGSIRDRLQAARLQLVDMYGSHVS